MLIIIQFAVTPSVLTPVVPFPIINNDNNNNNNNNDNNNNVYYYIIIIWIVIIIVIISIVIIITISADPICPFPSAARVADDGVGARHLFYHTVV